MLLSIALSACAESSILIFTFYWAPLIASVCSSLQTTEGLQDGPAPPLFKPQEGSLDPSGGGLTATSDAGVAARALLGEVPTDMVALHGAELPYILIYSTLMLGAMLGGCLQCMMRCGVVLVCGE